MIWYGAYVNSGSMESSIQDGILNTVKAFAPFHARPVEPDKFDGLYHYATASSWNLITISPPKGEWVGFWGGTPRLHLNVFQKNSYSGITLELEVDKDYQFWSYKVWKNGWITDWFISDPLKYFDWWRRDSIERVLDPYLRSLVGNDNVQLDNLDRFSPDRFHGRPYILEENNLIIKGSLQGNIAYLFPFEPEVAFASFVSYLRIPFKGLEFDPFNFGVFLDVQSRRVDLNERTELKAAYEHANSIRGIDQFSFLLFNLGPRDYPGLLTF